MVRYKSLNEFRNDENQVYVFGPHQYALYYWYKAYENQNIFYNSLVIHIDLHSDFLDPRNDFKGLFASEDIKQYIEDGLIGFDSFLKAALQMDLVDEIAFCCNNGLIHNKYGQFYNFESPVNLVTLLSQFTNNKELSPLETSLCKKILKGKIILDIDLDFFLDFEPCDDGIPTSLIPKKEELIKAEVDAINYLFRYASITTIATSPEIFYSGNGKKHLKKIMYIFGKYFTIPINFNDVKSLNCLTKQCT